VSRRTLVVVVTALAAFVAAGAVADGKRKPAPKPKYFKSVKIGDNFYLPAKMTVKPYTKVTWRWPSLSSGGGDTHDVKFQKAPKGIPHYQSEGAAADYRYAKLLTKVGTYHIICTFHEGEMEQTIVVRK
jgi:plastocyanin